MGLSITSRTLLLATLLAGCHWDLNDPGSDPLIDRFYFPVGVATDPNGKFLYVTNGNTDLRYGGGTLQLIDMDRFDCAVRAFRGDMDSACIDADHDRMLCQLDPLDPGIVDCAESNFIISGETVRLGNFAGSIRIRKTSLKERTLFIGVRGDPSITRVAVNLTNTPKLNCFDQLDPKERPDYRLLPDGKTVAASGCSQSHLIQMYSCAGRPNCMIDQPQKLPTEPFSMRLDEGTLPSGGKYARLVVAHLAGGQVSVIDASVDPPVVKNVSSPFFSPVDSIGRRGAFSLASSRPTDANATWYLTSNLQASMATFHIGYLGLDNHVVIPSKTFSVAPVFRILGDVTDGRASDSRDILFDPLTPRAFFTTNNPPSLVTLDTRVLPEQGTPSVPANLVSSAIDICQSPSHLELRCEQPGVAIEQCTARRLYVVCFLSNQLYTIDPDAAVVTDIVLLGRGPNDVAFNFGAGSDAEPAHRHAFVTEFAQSTVAEIDLDPKSPTHHRVIARLGLPPPLRTP